MRKYSLSKEVEGTMWCTNDNNKAHDWKITQKRNIEK